MNVPNFCLLDNPLVKNKVSLLRDKGCTCDNFRKLATELSAFLCYEACKDVKMIPYKLETPLEKTDGVRFSPVASVSILRAGLGMLSGALRCIPEASVGHIGMFRNEETLEPVKYYCKLPKNMHESVVFVMDPMLATGGSACDAIAEIKKEGAKDIRFLCLIAAPEGVQKLYKNHPDVKIYSSSLDRELNSKGYILPGLGDAGDRVFNTV